VYTGYIRSRPQGVFRNWNLFSNVYGGYNWDGQRTFTGLNVNGSYQLKNFWGGWAGINRDFESLSTGALRGGPAMVRPAGWNAWTGVNSDRRKPVSFSVDGSGRVEGETGGYNYNVGTSVSWRPTTRAEMSLRPGISQRHGTWQYVAARRDAATGETRYVMSEIDQTTASLTARLNYTFTPNLSLQFYAQPFVAAGEYSGFTEVSDPSAARFEDRLRTLPATELRACDGFYGVRPTGNGCGSEAGFAYRISRPDFNVRELRTNAVLRWEYRPGSALFFVWQQNRDAFDPSGDFALRNDTRELFGAPSTNVFLIKGTYWIGK
jgi:hypothetical protein